MLFLVVWADTAVWRYFSLYIHVVLILASHRHIFSPFYYRLFVVQTCQWERCNKTECSGFSTMGRRFVWLHNFYAGVSLTLHINSIPFTSIINVIKYNCVYYVCVCKYRECQKCIHILRDVIYVLRVYIFWQLLYMYLYICILLLLLLLLLIMPHYME